MVRTVPPEIYTADEVLALMGACSHDAPSGIRDRALLALLYRSGLRISEALSLRPSDVNFEAAEITVMRGKGARRRVVGLDPWAAGLLQRWLDCRRALAINGHAPLFCSISQPRPGRPMATANVRQKLARLRTSAGLQKRVHAHGLRHSFATELAREGVALPLIQGALGHSSPVTTHRYIQQIAPIAVVSAMASRPAPAGLAQKGAEA